MLIVDVTKHSLLFAPTNAVGNNIPKSTLYRFVYMLA